MFSFSAIWRLVHETEERNIVTYTTILAQTARRSRQSYIFTQQPQPNVIFKSQILFFVHHVPDVGSSQLCQLYVFIYLFFSVAGWLAGCLLEARGDVKYEVYQTFSTQLFWWASAIHHWHLRAARLHRRERERERCVFENDLCEAK